MTRTKSNFLVATFHALENTYRMYTPDFWGQPAIENHPFEGHSDFLNQKLNKFEKWEICFVTFNCTLFNGYENKLI